MNPMQSANDQVAAIFSDKLVIGNHDTITLFGSHPQTELRNYSKTISNLFQKKDDRLETEICNVLTEIEKFEVVVKPKRQLLPRNSNHNKRIKEEYERIKAYIEQISLFFQLQKAQLLKETKLLDKISLTVSQSVESLEIHINSGENLLSNKNKHNNSIPSQDRATDNVNEVDEWYARLERRLGDLEISHTVALQFFAQISLLKNSNLALIDGITAILTNTIPIWQNQMVFLLGIDKLEEKIKAQNQVSEIAEKLKQSEAFEFKLGKEAKIENTDEIISVMRKLKDALSDTVSLERQEKDARNAIVQK